MADVYGTFFSSLVYPTGELRHHVDNVQVIARSQKSGEQASTATRAALAIVEATSTQKP